MEIHGGIKKGMIIGLTGPNASGKGEVARYLAAKGFKYYSLSDIIREETKKLGIAASRENLILTGNALRKKYGPPVLAARIKKRLKGAAIVDSIRNTGEIEELRKLKDFVLLGIDAPVKVRFGRLRKRRRAGDSKSLKELILHEVRENSARSTDQQLSRCMKKADRIIGNDGSLEKLHKKIEGFLNEKKQAELG